MVLCINRPMKRSESSHHQFRKRIPADVLKIARGKKAIVLLPPERPDGEPVRVSFTLGDEVRFSLRTTDRALAKRRNAAVSEQLEELFAAYRDGPPAPSPLTTKQIAALAGDAYKAFAQGLEDNPVLSPDQWRAIQAAHKADLEAEPSPLGIYQNDAAYEAAKRAVQDANLERRHGRLADAILAFRKKTADAKTRPLLLREIAKVSIEATGKLARNAEGDYTPDNYATRFPEWKEEAPAQPRLPAALSFETILSRWEADGEKNRRSLSAFRGAVNAFQKHLGHDDASLVTKADVRAWKDAMVEKGLSAKTINGSYLAAIRTLYRWAVRNELFGHDPVEGVQVTQKRKAGRKPLPYDDAEVGAILKLADQETKPVLHWVPWLLAYTGARVGEITQLWGTHVRQRDGIHFIWITPTDDGGQLKTEESEREVPLHPMLIQRGFLDYVKSRGGGPLFYGGEGATPRPPKPGAVSHAAKGAANRVREWIRENGFTDKRKAPNHAFRHWFKRACAKAGVLDSVADAIQGHAGNRGVADDYRHRDLETMDKAIKSVGFPQGIKTPMDNP